MTASQSQHKIYNPGETEHGVRDHDGGYGEMPVDGPHHNRGDLERSHEPGYRETHPRGMPSNDEAVSPNGAQAPKNIELRETVEHTSSLALPMTDAEVLATVIQRLKHSESLDISEVRIAVEHANVILEGFVPHRFMQHAIEDVVDRCAGVHEIDNRIHVRHRPGEDEPTLSIGI